MSYYVYELGREIDTVCAQSACSFYHHYTFQSHTLCSACLFGHGKEEKPLLIRIHFYKILIGYFLYLHGRVQKIQKQQPSPGRERGTSFSPKVAEQLLHSFVKFHTAGRISHLQIFQVI